MLQEVRLRVHSRLLFLLSPCRTLLAQPHGSLAGEVGGSRSQLGSAAGLSAGLSAGLCGRAAAQVSLLLHEPTAPAGVVSLPSPCGCCGAWEALAAVPSALQPHSPWSQQEFCHSLQTHLSFSFFFFFSERVFSQWLEDIDVDPCHKHSAVSFHLHPNVISVVWTSFWTTRTTTVTDRPQTG